MTRTADVISDFLRDLGEAVALVASSVRGFLVKRGPARPS